MSEPIPTRHRGFHRVRTSYVTIWMLGRLTVQRRRIDGHHVGLWRRDGWLFIDLWTRRFEVFVNA